MSTTASLPFSSVNFSSYVPEAIVEMQSLYTLGKIVMVSHANDNNTLLSTFARFGVLKH